MSLKSNTGMGRKSKKQRYALYIATAAVIAGLYTIATLLIQPLAFGPVQFRISEALTILPVFTPVARPGLFIGCVLSNAVGVATGANVLGALDIVIGSSATLAAAVLSYFLRDIKFRILPHGIKIPLLATIPPVVVNAFVIGPELAFVDSASLWLNILFVALGQLAPCVILGSLLYVGIVKSKADRFIAA